MDIPDKLNNRLLSRRSNNSLRYLDDTSHADSIDFSSNDYLGLANSRAIFDDVHQFLIKNHCLTNGSTGSRLISGNSSLFERIEKSLCEIHKSPAALLFNSGYSANTGILSCIPQRNDVVMYDRLSHASIRDGIQLSKARAYAFEHNNLIDLEEKLKRFTPKDDGSSKAFYVVTESVFSMDGDSPDLIKLVQLCNDYGARLIIDEAHALGVYSMGLVQKLNLQDEVFARVVTFGKALGCHGAVILGKESLIHYLVNFSKPFIYTTALSPHALATILKAYEVLTLLPPEPLSKNIQHFKNAITETGLSEKFIPSNSAIQSCVIADNDRVKAIAKKLSESNYNVKAILSPTVEANQQRLRFCLHTFNTKNEIDHVLNLLSMMLNQDLSQL